MGTITKNFSYAEFEKSDIAKARGICNIIHSIEVRDNIRELTEKILQPLRDAWGKPLTISSGYRCPELNNAVGGSKTSSHLLGYGADIQADNQDAFNAFAVDFLTKNNIAFDQCIIEKSGRTQWLHIGLRNINFQQRRQTFAITR